MTEDAKGDQTPDEKKEAEDTAKTDPKSKTKPSPESTAEVGKTDEQGETEPTEDMIPKRRFNEIYRENKRLKEQSSLPADDWKAKFERESEARRVDRSDYAHKEMMGKLEPIVKDSSLPKFLKDEMLTNLEGAQVDYDDVDNVIQDTKIYVKDAEKQIKREYGSKSDEESGQTVGSGSPGSGSKSVPTTRKEFRKLDIGKRESLLKKWFK